MDTSALIAGFLQGVGKLVGDLRAQAIGKIDLELLNLKRIALAEKLEDFKRDLAIKVRHEKGRVEQDMISRGIGGSVRSVKLASIDQQAGTDTERTVREFGRALEEIALLERKVREQNDTYLKRFVRYLRGLFAR
jgi:hypothetical protein